MISDIESMILIGLIVLFLIVILYFNIKKLLNGDNTDTFKKYLDTSNDKKPTYKAINDALTKNDFKKVEKAEYEKDPVSLRSKEAQLLKKLDVYNDINLKDKSAIRIWINKIRLKLEKIRNKSNSNKLKLKLGLLKTINEVVLRVFFHKGKGDGKSL